MNYFSLSDSAVDRLLEGWLEAWTADMNDPSELDVIDYEIISSLNMSKRFR